MGAGTFSWRWPRGPALAVCRPVPRRRRRVRHVRGRAQDRRRLVPALVLRDPLRATAAVGVLGGLVGTAPVAWLARGFGWRGALGAAAIVTLAGAAPVLALVRDHPPAGRAAGPRRAPGWATVVAGLGRVLRNPHTWPPFLAFFFLYSATNNLFFWIVPCLRDVYGLGLTDAALYATALVAGAPRRRAADRLRLGPRAPPPSPALHGPDGAQFVAWAVFVLTLGRLPLGGLYAPALRHGAGGRGVRPDLAARARGQSARARRRRGGGGEPRRVRGRRPDPGAARRRCWTPAGRARWPRALAFTRSRPTGRPSPPPPSSSSARCLVSLFFRETRGQNVYVDPRPPAHGRLIARLVRQRHPRGLELLQRSGSTRGRRGRGRQGLEDRRDHHQAREPLVVGGHDVPRRVWRAGVADHVPRRPPCSRPSGGAPGRRRARTSSSSRARRAGRGTAAAAPPRDTWRKNFRTIVAVPREIALERVDVLVALLPDVAASRAAPAGAGARAAPGGPGRPAPPRSRSG